jgi:hypothetical protein
LPAIYAHLISLSQIERLASLKKLPADPVVEDVKSAAGLAAKKTLQ